MNFQLTGTIADTRSPTYREPVQCSAPPARAIGLLVGLAAATPGLAPPISAIPARPWHLFIILALALALFYRVRNGYSAIFRLTRLEVSLILFAVATTFVELLNVASLTYSIDYVSLSRPLFWLAIFKTVALTIQTKEGAYRFFFWFAIPAIPSVAIGLGQVLGIEAIQSVVLRLGSDTGGFAARLEDGRLIRATGLVQHWTSFGSYLCTVVAASVALLVLARTHRVGRPLFAWILLTILSLGIFSTLTLSSIFTAITIFLVGALTAKAFSRALPLLLILGIAGTAVLGPMLSARMDQQFSAIPTSNSLVPSTLQYRYRIWATETIPMIQERPIMGWGSNVYEATVGRGEPRRLYPSNLHWHSPESQWLSVLMTHGWIGLSSFLLILGCVATLLWRASRRGAKWIARPIWALFILMLVAAFTAPVFMNHGLPVGFWAMMGVLAGAPRHARPPLATSSERKTPKMGTYH